MKEPPGPDLALLRPAIKSRWTELLEAKPAPPRAPAAFVHADMLVFMLDGTLDRLALRLREKKAPNQTERGLVPSAPVSSGCQCGLHLLLDYYEAGAQALRETLPTGCGRLSEETIQHFNGIARDEMDALCGVCRFHGGQLCSLGNLPSPSVAP